MHLVSKEWQVDSGCREPAPRSLANRGKTSIWLNWSQGDLPGRHSPQGDGGAPARNGPRSGRLECPPRIEQPDRGRHGAASLPARSLLQILLACGVAISALGTSVAADKPGRERRAGGKPTNGVIVQFRDDVSDAEAARLVARHGASISKRLRQSRQLVVHTASVAAAEALVRRLNASPLVLSAEIDRVSRARRKAIPTDTGFPDQWYFHNTGQTGGFDNRDICAEKAWDITRGTSTVIIALIDDGFQLNHPDL
ncbi:MAG: hypothetical protein AAB403_23490, partial [Planctomycetota bacterium]